MIWHHGTDHIPTIYNFEYWNGSIWQPISQTGTTRWDLDLGSATPTEHIFTSVVGSKLRYNLYNCNITHGWIYEFEVYGFLGSNTAPIANNDNYSVNEDTTLNAVVTGVLINDTDPENNPLTAAWMSGPTNGSVTLNPNGSFAYIPNTNWNGIDTFTYRAYDGTAYSTAATVIITVNAVNDAPVANADSYSTNEDTILTVPAVGVLTNDTDVDGNPLTSVLVSTPANGSVTLNANGSFSYAPNTDWNGADSFTYGASDGTLPSNTVTVSITVNAVNDPPVANPDSYTVNEDAPLSISARGVLTNDTDAETTPALVQLMGSPAHTGAGGTFVFPGDGSFQYQADPNWFGTDSFTYRVHDGTASGNTTTVTITVNPVNDLPTGNADSYSTNEDTTLTIAAPGVLNNDSDPVENTPLTTSLVTGPTHGALTLNADGSFTYTPSANWNGIDGFVYQAYDGTNYTSDIAVMLTANAVNDGPSAGDDGPYTTNEDIPLTVADPGVLGNDTDGDSSTLTVSSFDATSANGGTVSVAANGSFIYTSVANWSGTDNFNYTVSDGTLTDTALVTIIVGVVNDVPVAGNDGPYATDEDTPLTVDVASGVLTNDTDPESDPLTAVLDTTTAHGALTLNSDGSFTYVPTTGFFGTNTFTYHVTDGTDVSSPATVTIDVGMVNRPGGLAEDDFAITGPSTPVTLDVLANDHDPDGDLLSVEQIGEPANGIVTIAGAGMLTYTPDPGFYGEEAFRYYVTDGFGAHDWALITIVVWRPVPLCSDFDGTENDVVRASVPNTTVPSDAGVYCRVVVENGAYIRSGGEIGDQNIINLGILQAVEVFSLDNHGYSVPSYQNGVQICLKGQGRLIYLNAWNMPRIASWLDSESSGEFTCGWIPYSGTVILVPVQ
jgi:VCBS repeat-containing protein